MADTVTALNTASGQVGVVPAVYLTLPGVKDTLVEVPEGTKSYEPSKFKPTTADEYREAHKSGKKPVEDKPLDVAPASDK